MKALIIIHEECHGAIGYVHNYKRAIDFLYCNDWFDEEEMIANFGVDWLNRISKWDIDIFNKELNGCFQLEVAEIY